MANYFNTLNLRQQLAQLGKCRFMGRDEFADGASYLQGSEPNNKHHNTTSRSTPSWLTTLIH